MRLGFREDTRGVSALVGAVLLLGILVIALASYQAIIVPQQNAQTEFDHNQQVEDEMVDFRNALLEARLDERERAPSVKLGTRYQSRTLAVNPPPATGTLQSANQSNMRVFEDGESEPTLDLQGNQFFEYTPSYSEYRDAGTIRYENTVVYHEFQSANVPLSQQRLVRGNTITLVPSEPDIDENGIDRVTYEPDPSRFRVLTVEDPTIELPTELSEEDWEDLLENEDTESVEVNNGILIVELNGPKEIRYTPVADQEDLPDDERDQERDDDPATEINPAAPGGVQLVGVQMSEPGNSDATLTFRNRGASDVTIESGRINFYRTQGGRPTSLSADICAVGDGFNPRSNWEVGEDFESVDPPITLPAGENKSIVYDFDIGNVQASNDFFFTTLRFSSGAQGTYIASGNYGPDIPAGASDACADDSGGDDDGNGNGDDGNGDENGGDQSPSFDSLSAEVTSFQSGQSVIQEVTVSGDINNPDTNGDIEIEVIGDDESTRSIGMSSSFSEPFSTGSGSSGESSVDVIVRLLNDQGESYVVCSGERSLDSDGDEITLDEFDCS